jgi:hypothetical protein
MERDSYFGVEGDWTAWGVVSNVSSSRPLSSLLRFGSGHDMFQHSKSVLYVQSVLLHLA